MESLLELPILKLIKQEESHFFELKASLKYDYKTGNSNPDLEYEVAKATTAFMNADGGILLIGVNDKTHETLGLENDYRLLARNKRDQDGFELHLHNVIRDHLGKLRLKLMEISFPEIKGREICKIKVSKAPDPVFLKRKKRDEYRFIARIGNESSRLNVKDAIEYILRHWNYIQNHSSGDFVRETIEELFHELKSRFMIAVPYDINMLKQRVDIKNFIATLEQKNPSELINLVDLDSDKEIQFEPPLHFKRHGRNITRFDLLISKDCECNSRNMNIELKIRKDGVIVFNDQYLLHFIVEHRLYEVKNALRVDLLIKDIKNILLFLKFTYEQFGVQKFEFIINGNDFKKIKIIRGKEVILLNCNANIFTKPPRIRTTLNCESITLETIDDIIWTHFEELARYLNKDVITIGSFLEEMKKTIQWL